MSDINVLNSDPIECPECKKYIKYKDRPIKGKINWNIRRVKDSAKHLIISTKKYGIKNFSQLFQVELWAKNGRACVKNYEKFDDTGEEHAIFMVNFKDKAIIDKNYYVFGSGVDILVDYLIVKSIKFKIFNCHNSSCFDKAIKTTPAQNIWIFGHGDRHGISFGKQDYYTYCKLMGTNRRSFIAQLHCCNDDGTTLWEFLSDRPGIFFEGYHTPVQNREAIKTWIKENEINSHILLKYQ